MIDATAVYVVLVIFLATLIRSTVGFGEALVGVPLLALRVPVAVAAPLAVVVSILIAGLIVAQDWRDIEVRSAGWLVASSLFGIPLGLLLLTLVDDHVVVISSGVTTTSDHPKTAAGCAISMRSISLEQLVLRRFCVATAKSGFDLTSTG